jgi:hypothetical protein
MTSHTNVIVNPSIPTQNTETFWKAKNQKATHESGQAFYDAKIYKEQMIEGYKAMADLNSQIVEDFWALDKANWPKWE